MKRPWMKWYPGDWRADPLVRACEPITRYVWLEMLGLMHEAEPYGHLVLSGRAMDYKTLSRLIAVEVDDVKGAVKELERLGVFSRTDDGTIFSRRMIRDEIKAKSSRENGGKGGNPTLINQGVKPTQDNPKDNAGVKAHMPEARIQKENIKSDFDRFWEAWPDKTSPKKPAVTSFEKAIKRGASMEAIMDGLAAYVAGKPAWAHWAHATTWLNQDRWTVRFDSPPATPEHFDADSAKWGARLTAYRTNGTWESSWGAKPGDPACQVPAHLFEKRAA